MTEIPIRSMRALAARRRRVSRFAWRGWLLVCGLTVACGDAGSGSKSGSQAKAAAPDSATAAEAPAKPEPPPRPKMTVYQGAYRRTSAGEEFLTCGAKRGLGIDGDAEPRIKLFERWRWLSVQFERPLYVVLAGAIIADTARADTTAGAPAGSPRITERFYLMRVDTVRPWDRGDCGLERAPRW